MTIVEMHDRYFTTDDGVRLHYVEAGGENHREHDDSHTTNTNDNTLNTHNPDANRREVKTLILLPGWSQSCDVFVYQVQAFASRTRRVIALDTRGHGKSDKPEYGYRLSRLACDVRNLLQHLSAIGASDNNNEQRHYHHPKVDVLAHSASVSIMFTYLEMFGLSSSSSTSTSSTTTTPTTTTTSNDDECCSIHSLILVDQPICMLNKDPGHWTTEDCRQYGAIMTTEQLVTACREIAASEHSSIEVQRRILREMLVPMFSQRFLDRRSEDFERILDQSLKFPREYAAQMLWNVAAGTDFRDLLHKITIPALCVGSVHSHVPHDCMSYMASQMPNAEHEIIQDATGTGGGHFAFYEDPEAFNMDVDHFLRSTR